jgi:hypothetical protein
MEKLKQRRLKERFFILISVSEKLDGQVNYKEDTIKELQFLILTKLSRQVAIDQSVPFKSANKKSTESSISFSDIGRETNGFQSP